MNMLLKLLKKEFTAQIPCAAVVAYLLYAKRSKKSYFKPQIDFPDYHLYFEAVAQW
jgi:hypothetical protein